MDEKKVREAIEIINNFTVWNIDELWLDCEDMEELVNTLTIALEKQLPKKPEKVVSAIYGTSYECKNCGSEIEPLDIYADYCKWCGQRLDWSES